MTTPDIYTVEARRRLAESWEAQGVFGMKSPYLRGDYDTNTDVAVLAATLRELNWQPPVDPDLVEARKVVAAVHDEPCYRSFARSVLDGKEDGGKDVKSALAAIKRGRELERGA